MLDLLYLVILSLAMFVGELKMFFRILAILFSISFPLSAYSIDFHVVANKTKVNEAPWDGISGTGAGKGAIFFGIPTSGPPDIAICVVTVSENKHCLFKGSGNKFHSLCQNSFDCDFPNVEIKDSNFGLVIIDLDTVQLDFIDMVILIRDPEAKPEDLDALEALTRAETAKLTPALTQGERERRERPVQRFELAQCSGELECTLRQSTLRVRD